MRQFVFKNCIRQNIKYKYKLELILYYTLHEIGKMTVKSKTYLGNVYTNIIGIYVRNLYKKIPFKCRRSAVKSSIGHKLVMYFLRYVNNRSEVFLINLWYTFCRVLEDMLKTSNRSDVFPIKLFAY
jgi:hypothetical protein